MGGDGWMGVGWGLQDRIRLSVYFSGGHGEAEVAVVCMRGWGWGVGEER